MPAFSIGPVVVSLDKGRTMVFRTDKPASGCWPKLTCFHESVVHGGIDIHLTWPDKSRPRRFLARISLDEMRAISERFSQDLARRWWSELRRVRLPDLARQGYRVLFVADPAGMETYIKSFTTAGRKGRLALTVEPFERKEEMFAPMGLADPRELPRLVQIGVIDRRPITLVRVGGAEEDALHIVPIERDGGLRWFVRPVHTLCQGPFAEAMPVSLLRHFPANFYDNVMVIVREMGLDQWGFEERELLAAWRKAKAVEAA